MGFSLFYYGRSRLLAPLALCLVVSACEENKLECLEEAYYPPGEKIGALISGEQFSTPPTCDAEDREDMLDYLASHEIRFQIIPESGEEILYVPLGLNEDRSLNLEIDIPPGEYIVQALVDGQPRGEKHRITVLPPPKIELKYEGESYVYFQDSKEQNHHRIYAQITPALPRDGRLYLRSDPGDGAGVAFSSPTPELPAGASQTEVVALRSKSARNVKVKVTQIKVDDRPIRIAKPDPLRLKFVGYWPTQMKCALAKAGREDDKVTLKITYQNAANHSQPLTKPMKLTVKSLSNAAEETTADAYTNQTKTDVVVVVKPEATSFRLIVSSSDYRIEDARCEIESPKVAGGKSKKPDDHGGHGEHGEHDERDTKTFMERMLEGLLYGFWLLLGVALALGIRVLAALQKNNLPGFKTILINTVLACLVATVCFILLKAGLSVEYIGTKIDESFLSQHWGFIAIGIISGFAGVGLLKAFGLPFANEPAETSPPA